MKKMTLKYKKLHVISIEMYLHFFLKTKKGCIIKTWEIIYKPIIDSIYILTGVLRMYIYLSQQQHNIKMIDLSSVKI